MLDHARSERRIQNRVVALFTGKLGYRSSASGANAPTTAASRPYQWR
jgi:hypothetical protein